MHGSVNTARFASTQMCFCCFYMLTKLQTHNTYWSDTLVKLMRQQNALLEKPKTSLVLQKTSDFFQCQSPSRPHHSLTALPNLPSSHDPFCPSLQAFKALHRSVQLRQQTALQNFLHVTIQITLHLSKFLSLFFFLFLYTQLYWFLFPLPSSCICLLCLNSGPQSVFPCRNEPVKVEQGHWGLTYRYLFREVC